MVHRHSIAALALAVLLVAPTPLISQSVVARTPNLSGGWVGEPGTIQFNFLHRFWTVDTDADDVGDKIVNSPSFLLAAPIPGDLLIGALYASNSQVIPGEFNEWELFGRWRALSSDAGSPVDLSLQGAFNGAGESADGELLVGVPLRYVTLFGALRGFSDAYGTGEGKVAFGGGASVALTDAVSLAGDVLSVPDRLDGQKVAWSAGIQVRVPTTPHTFSLQTTNTRTATLQGSSVGFERVPGEDSRVWGFEFTIPVTLSRYFGGGGGSAEAPAAEDAGRLAVTMTNTLRYGPETLRIRVGETVTWRNTSDLIHTVTADPEKAIDPANVRLPEGAEVFDSGNMRPGETFSRTFRVPGEYVYFCVPHEAAGMVGRIVVSP